ncbi:hypothetical protein CKM354_000408100 [Cercospora kikuchii]|uniref:BHLH domain-containing protein n=1 Tax=Cercospora kikuchii TaxID=84275 RepID=A0A9P3FFF3_9PEZI|nr:uncharacterized protein CKM354_000408100 [Cercospora kikuchii]GIZ40754.1 hypothetical protein CKM354_000408100 [Cercospora kikuchii]
MDNPYHHHQGQQPQSIDMLAVYGGAKEFSGDSFSFDLSQVPPSGQPLLSGSEQNLIADFFTHPDDFSSGKHVAFGYYEEPSTNTAGSSNAAEHLTPSHSLQHLNVLHDTNFGYTHNQSHNSNNVSNHFRSEDAARKSKSYSADEINSMATYSQQAMSQNDVAAATTLSGFRNNASNEGFALDGASWGAMSMSGLNASSAGGFGSDRQWLHSSVPRTATNNAPSRNSGGSLVEMVIGDMHRSAYVPTTAPQSARPFGTFGSDTSFSNGNFAGTATDHSQKVGNLLGIPLAPQAAGISPNNSHDRFRQDVPTNHGSQPNHGQQFAPQYSTAWNGAGPYSQPGSNKRPNSNSASGVKHEYDEGDDDEGDGGARKRRKSMATPFQPTHTAMYAQQYPMPPPQMPYANGPMTLPVHDVRRGPPRKKENLTDDQKRANHIVSEKKRREIINQGYRDLNELTPALAMGKSGLSRSECLMEINNYLYALQLANARIIKDLQLDPAAFAIAPPAGQTSGY